MPPHYGPYKQWGDKQPTGEACGVQLRRDEGSKGKCLCDLE